jgi:o-succinylbenzoate synthase
VPFQFAYRRYTARFRAPVRTAHGVWPAREGVIVRLQAEDGRVGFGEAAPIPWFGTETVDQVETASQAFGNRIEAANTEILGTLPTLMNALNCARSQIAASSAASEAQPVSRSLPVAALLPAGRTVLEKIGPLTEAGFRTFKWKVGVGDLSDEVALLDDVLSQVPSGSKLRLDANGAWDRRKAERWLERCAERPIDFIEQPVAHDGRGTEDLLLGLAHDYPTPLALDESIATGAQVQQWLDRGWPGIFVIKASLLGDPAETLSLLEKRNASVVFSSALETAVGAQAALRLAFSWKGAPRALGFGVWPLFEDGRFDGPFAAPFIRWEDINRLNPEAVWNALG